MADILEVMEFFPYARMKKKVFVQLRAGGGPWEK
jgi:hypothetical protein